ncbi:MAG: phosphomannomutase [Ruminococcaceae bacterium]|nr:phosphomannomutase [Oscillospiraceae bacterium]
MIFTEGIQMYKDIKVIAMDLDGTLTQHKTPLSPEHRAILTALSKKYKLLMVGAGQVLRIFNQLEKFPIDIIGNYGMQYGKYNSEKGEIDIVKDIVADCDKELIAQKIEMLRDKYGFLEYAGESVEYHPSGCVTFPVLGTKAKQEDKLSFDPDRVRRRKIYDDVVNTFSDYCVFVGGSSSFDMAPKPYNKYYALDLYCKENSLSHDEVVYIGDDYGLGGNDESVYKSDFNYITIDNYLDFPKVIEALL